MGKLRRHFIVRLVIYVLLTWTAVDLLVPQLCAAENFAQAASNQAPDRADDCFCCTLIEDPQPFCVVVETVVSVAPKVVLADDVASGFPQPLYHPPV